VNLVEGGLTRKNQAIWWPRKSSRKKGVNDVFARKHRKREKSNKMSGRGGRGRDSERTGGIIRKVVRKSSI